MQHELHVCLDTEALLTVAKQVAFPVSENELSIHKKVRRKREVVVIRNK